MNRIEGAVKLAPFNPSSVDVLSSTLKLVCLKEGDVVYDLGCGDGRVLISLAIHDSTPKGVTFVGVEYDSKFCERARMRVKELGIEDRITIEHGDATAKRCDDATVIFVYLTKAGNSNLANNIKRAHGRGARIVSNMFSLKYLGDPTQSVVCDGITKLHLYHMKGVQKEKEKEEEEKEQEVKIHPLVSLLQDFLDPANNPVLLQIFNASMLGLVIILLVLLGFSSSLELSPDLTFHLRILTGLSLFLVLTLHWWFSELLKQKNNKEK